MASRKVPRAARSRRQEHSSSTRRALLESAAEVFTENGYAGTSLDEVVAAARVTKGALYHHYSGKLDLFEHVVERAQKDAAKAISKELRKHKDPWERAQMGLRVFLQICEEPAYRRLVMQEGPVALGPDRLREIEQGTTFGLVDQIVDELLDDEVDKDLREAFATIFYGSLGSAGAYVADADDPEAASENAEAVIGSVLAALRSFGALGKS